MNKCMFVGTVRRDPVRLGEKGVAFSLACLDGYKKKDGDDSVTFINCVAWNDRVVGIIYNEVQAGSRVAISTQANVRKIEKDGVTYYETQFKIDSIESLVTPTD